MIVLKEIIFQFFLISSLTLVLENASEDLHLEDLDGKWCNVLCFCHLLPYSTIPQNTNPLSRHPQGIAGSSTHFPLPLTYFELKRSGLPDKIKMPNLYLS